MYQSLLTIPLVPLPMFGAMTTPSKAFSTESLTLPATPNVVVRMTGTVKLPAGAVINYTGVDAVTNKVYITLNGVLFTKANSPVSRAGSYNIDFRCVRRANEISEFKNMFL